MKTKNEEFEWKASELYFNNYKFIWQTFTKQIWFINYISLS